MKEGWYYFAADRDAAVGPMELPGLQALFQAGLLNPETLVSKDAGESWIPYGDAVTSPPKEAPPVLPVPKDVGETTSIPAKLTAYNEDAALKAMFIAVGAALAFIFFGSRRLINSPILIIFLSLPWLPIISEPLRRLSTDGPSTSSRVFMRFVVYPLAGIMTLLPAGVFAMNAHELRLPLFLGYAVFGLLPALFGIVTVVLNCRTLSLAPAWIRWTTSGATSISVVGVCFMSAFILGTLIGLLSPA